MINYDISLHGKFVKWYATKELPVIVSYVLWDWLLHGCHAIMQILAM